MVKSTGVFHLPKVCGHFGGNVPRVKNAGLHSFPFPSKTSKWRPRYGLWQLVETRNWNAFLQDTFQSRKRASFSKFHLFPGISGIFRWNAEIRTEISIKWKAPGLTTLLVHHSWTLFDVTLGRRHEICFCDVSKWTWASQIYRLWKIEKKKNVTLLFGEVFVEVAVVVAEVSYYFQPGALVSTQMTSPSQASPQL